MTQSRATYWAWVENQRAHKASEALEKAKNDEIAAHNRIMEQQGAEANAELAKAHREAEANARLAVQQAEDASKRNYEAAINKAKVDERVARMQVTNSNKQKEADRQLQERIANMGNEIQQGNLDISRLLAENTVGRTDAEKQKWANDMDIAQKNYSINVDRLLQDAEDLARKKADSSAARKLAEQKFKWDKAKDRFQQGLDLFNAGRNSANDLINNSKTLTGIARDIFNLSKAINK